MAFFALTLEVIKTSEKHPNADKLSICTLEGLPFTFVTGLNQFQVGEQVLYVPIDAIVPDSLAEKLGVLKKLSGKNKDRVKTCTIRGAVSQGIVGKFSILEPFLIEKWGTDWATKCIELKPTEITEWLGVTKYEPPVIPDKSGNLKSLPCGLSVYDIEGCERYHVSLQKLMDQKVWILEKLEGSNGSVTYDPSTDSCFVNQRRFTIEEIDGHEHAWWSVARKQHFIDFAHFLGNATKETVTVYFEVCGPAIQGNIYKLSEVKGFIFDVKVGNSFMDKGKMFSVLQGYFGEGQFAHAPILSSGVTLREWLGSKTVVEASNGESKLYKTLREGIVITPEVEQLDEVLGGRLILKQRDPIYLSGTDN